MEIKLNIAYEADDNDPEKVEIALDLIEGEARTFAARVIEVLEEHGMTDVKVKRASFGEHNG